MNRSRLEQLKEAFEEMDELLERILQIQFRIEEKK